MSVQSVKKKENRSVEMKVIYTEKSPYFVKNGVLYLDLILRKVPAMINITNDRRNLQDKVNIWRSQFY